jgi:hypothetical protein
MYKHLHIVDMLEEHCASGALVVHWRMFGTNGSEAYSPRPVTERFQMRAPNIDDHIKTIAHLSDVDPRASPFIHYVYLKQNKVAVDTAGNIVKNRARNHKKPADVALLYHYKTKSFKEYIAKRKRGQADDAKVDEKLLEEAKGRKIGFKADVYDSTMWMKMKEYVPKYAIYGIP